MTPEVWTPENLLRAMVAGDECVVAAESAHLYVGTIPELAEFDGVPPDMTFDTADEIRRRLPRWSSELTVTEYFVIQ